MTSRIELRRDAGRVGPLDGPWIRRRQVSRIRGSADPHELAQVVDRRGDPVGWGLLSPVSDILVRLLTFGPSPPEEDWLEQRLQRAFEARDAYALEAEGTTGYRQVNSEGDGLPGLTIDRYEEAHVIQLTTAPMAAREMRIIEWLRKRSEGPIHIVLPVAAANREGFDPATRHDAVAERLRFREHGLSFSVPAPPSQKTGAYFDQRGNRRIVAHLARRHGGPVLDLGCHVGGFALHARKLGADVVAVDQSEVALEFAAHNAGENDLDGIAWLREDMFAKLDHPALSGPFGTAIVDPPKMASTKRDIPNAMDALQRLVSQVAARIDLGGHLVVCSCSHHLGREHLDRAMVVAAQRSGRQYTKVAQMGAGFDHPVALCHRQGEYLRVSAYQRRG